MKARAPGKLVLSGAYSVLEGAPAVVTAVDRHAYADSARTPSIVTPEVRAALGTAPAPYFDATELRAEGRKLGLGSSAAILVASLAAASPAAGGVAYSEERALRAELFARALRAHREAQGGGSGVDVAASTWGGTLLATRSESGLELSPVALPSALVVEVWSSGSAASTRDFLAKVAELRAAEPDMYGTIMEPLIDAARLAAHALRGGDLGAWLNQLDAQRQALSRLGAAAGIPIVTAEVSRLAALARDSAGVVLPSGAGGGDICLWLGQSPSPASFRALAAELGHVLIPMSLHAAGVQRFQEGIANRGS